MSHLLIVSNLTNWDLPIKTVATPDSARQARSNVGHARSNQPSKKSADPKKTKSALDGFVMTEDEDSDDDVPPVAPSRRPLQANPKQSPRKKRNGDEIERDLIKKPKVNCNHTDGNELLSEWTSLPSAYFAKVRLERLADEGTPHPFKCSGCKKNFKTGKDAQPGDIKVTDGRPVRCCPNATKAGHSCLFALGTSCKCYQALLKKSIEKAEAKKAGVQGNSSANASRASSRSAKRKRGGD